jgi:hypothetical protein
LEKAIGAGVKLALLANQARNIAPPILQVRRDLQRTESIALACNARFRDLRRFIMIVDWRQRFPHCHLRLATYHGGDCCACLSAAGRVSMRRVAARRIILIS